MANCNYDPYNRSEMQFHHLYKLQCKNHNASDAKLSFFEDLEQIIYISITPLLLYYFLDPIKYTQVFSSLSKLQG